MPGSGWVVLDIGKTHSKLSLWSDDGRLLEKLVRRNQTVERCGYHTLDIRGTEAWLEKGLRSLAKKAEVRAIIPVAHGAAAAVIEGRQVLIPPLCYDRFPRSAFDADYTKLRDEFPATGSPRLPGGLNLGNQLFRWAKDFAPGIWPRRGLLVTYPQYWAWVLSGVAATEITSLGCHTDLWRPFERKFSHLAQSAGWVNGLAPLHPASEVLGEISASWAARTGLPRTCVIYCGIHDSNAALHGARVFPQFSGKDLTILSTGTWFVSMRAPSEKYTRGMIELDESRDTLVNVDLNGDPIPSARFMGGREFEKIQGGALLSGDKPARDEIMSCIQDVVEGGAMILPSFVPGVGPFPKARGHMEGVAVGTESIGTAASLYLSLLAHESLSLIGTRDTILIEGPFARDPIFISSLATLRRDCEVYTVQMDGGLAFGARRLAVPSLLPPQQPDPVKPLDIDICAYAERWRRLSIAYQVAA